MQFRHDWLDAISALDTFILRNMITLSNLTKMVTSGIEELTILSDVSLSIPEGQFVSLTGASSSGKSTLLVLIAGLDPPSSGRITIDDDEVTKMNEDGLA